MKKLHNALLAVWLTIILAACSTPSMTTTPSISVTKVSTATTTPTFVATSEPAVVKFSDPVLEEMIRGALGKLEGDITVTEAEAVTRLNLSNELQRYISEDTPIKDISGLENFTNLEYLDLSFHEITDVSPLAGLNNLTLLSLGGNPAVDITPLASLTNLKVLILSNCSAQDYSPLAKLVNLKFLMLDNSSITDVSPLASLKNLKGLYLANSPASDYSTLSEIYPNLENKDFIVASTLEDFGFSMDGEYHQAYYSDENVAFTINHSEWGAPRMEWDANIIRMSMNLETGYVLDVGFYGDIDAYVLQMYKDGEMIMNYVYDLNNGGIPFGSEDRARSEQVMLAALGVVEDEDVLLAPIRIFNDTIQKTFKMTADRLYALQFGPPTLKNLGFFPDEENAVWRYEQQDERAVSIEIHNPEWGEKDYDLLFFMSLSDEYRIVLTYHSEERKFDVGADDNDQGGAKYEYFIDTNEHTNDWCSNEGMTVEEYLINAYNDPEIKNIYLHAVELIEQYVGNTFGMTMEELYALPTGE